jgi:hypothetical protein
MTVPIHLSRPNKSTVDDRPRSNSGPGVTLGELVEWFNHNCILHVVLHFFICGMNIALFSPLDARAVYRLSPSLMLVGVTESAVADSVIIDDLMLHIM